MNIVITGAADGIGKALATVYVQQGHSVIGVDVDAQRAQATQAELGENMRFVMADLSRTETLEDVAAQLGNDIDVLIHNAGISEVGHFANTNPAKQQAVIDINLIAPMVLTRHLLANNALKTGASVVFMSSLSHYVSYPGASVYGGTKSGLASYARTLSVTYPNMHVLTVYPGPTRTAHARRYSPDNSREDQRMLPQDLAARVVSAVEKRQRVLIPGAASWVFAIIGRWFPAVTDFAMRKMLLDKFERA